MQHYGRRIQITGSETFQTKVIGLIASHGLDVQMRDPVQQAMLNEAIKQQAADRPDARDSINATPVMPATRPFRPVLAKTRPARHRQENNLPRPRPLVRPCRRLSPLNRQGNNLSPRKPRTLKTA
ncbi:hypothetical protein UA70_17970 [Raoultella planticola]|nr:hypothetical protein UA70_17970 [Raoultella planticola]